ncbi:MAG: 4-hydroxy-tetrahydrodipicolinate synthase, partial [Chitinophagaceae bacterium]
YIVSLGTTGETATLTAAEKQSIWEFTSETANGRIKLVAGIGGNDTRVVGKQIRDFSVKGFSAVLSVSPYYSKPTQEGIYQHYKYLSEHSDLPLILYNVPGRTGSSISAETTCRLANDLKNVIATKEASANFDQFNQILRDKPAGFDVISGDDPITLPMMAMGAIGVISVVGNALPRMYSDMVRDCMDGDFKKASLAHLKMIEFTSLLFQEGNPAGIKSALKTLGICQDYVRLPLVKASEQLGSKISHSIGAL